jgi:hypothetical protein
MGGYSQIIAPMRNNKVLETELPDSLIVYDVNRDQGHCLQPIAALVWRSCDSQTRVSEIARVVEEQYNVNSSEDVVLFIIGQLKKKGLLEEGAVHPELNSLIPRRDIVRKYIPAALVLPFIFSVSAPTRAQLVSGAPTPAGGAPTGGVPTVPENFPEASPQVRVGGGQLPSFIFSGSALSFLLVGVTRRKRRKKRGLTEEVTKDNADVQWHIEGTHDTTVPISYGTVPGGMKAVISAEPLVEGEIYFVQGQVHTDTASSIVTQFFRIEKGQVVEVQGDIDTEE